MTRKRSRRPQPKKVNFNACTARYSVLKDRIISPLHLSEAFDPAKTPPDRRPPLMETSGLWDTGATRSMITNAVVKHLKLTPIGIQNINHAGGTSQSFTYIVNFYLPNQVGIAGVRVTECPDTTGNFGAIIGMDIISRGDFSITNVNGATWMSYRYPSIKGIDYVVEANRIIYAGVPKHVPCPCGKLDENGKHLKFKDCHGKDL